MSGDLGHACLPGAKTPREPACLGFLTREGGRGLLSFPAPAGARAQSCTTGRYLISGGQLWGCELSLCP